MVVLFDNNQFVCFRLFFLFGMRFFCILLRKRSWLARFLLARAPAERYAPNAGTCRCDTDP
jgi:hypothetical protein